MRESIFGKTDENYIFYFPPSTVWYICFLHDFISFFLKIKNKHVKVEMLDQLFHSLHL